MAAASHPVCFNTMGRLMPVARAETARRLAKEGLQQERIAEHLGVSQAMVSKYLRRPPRTEALVPARFLSEVIDAGVKRALHDEATGRVPPWCPLCSTLWENGYCAASSALTELPECLRHEQVRTLSGSEEVLGSLSAAEERIRNLSFHRILPQVRTNLAMSVANPKDSRDVAAFPGRLIELRGEIRGASGPEFGSSSHLAQLLLKLRRHQAHVRAILNARWGDDVRHALRASALRFRPLKRERGELLLVVPKDVRWDAVIDPGAFGIEPAIYLLGETAQEVVSKVEKVLAHLPPGGEAQ